MAQTDGTTMYHGYESSTDDIDQLFDNIAGEGWDFRYHQLTPGPLGAWNRMVCLPEISVHWYRYRQAIHVRESHSHPAVFFTFVIEAEASPRWFARPFDADMALLYFPQQEQDYVIPKGLFSMGLMIQESLCQRMGWRFESEACRRVDRQALLALKERGWRLTRWLWQTAHVSQEQLLVEQERLAMCLAKVLEPWLHNHPEGQENIVHPGRSFSIVRNAIDLIEEWPDGKKFDIVQLASAVGAHRRTLYRAFHDYLGVGPYEYSQIVRLHTYRHVIRELPSTHGAITRAAQMVGFSHMGRFSTLYRRHFSERPLDTLRRWKQAPEPG